MRSLVFQPALAGLIRRRSSASVVLGLGVVYGVAAALGAVPWACPSARILHYPCPGCGLTRAVLALLQGDVSRMLALHAFAPLVVALGALLALAVVLPDGARARFAFAIETAERRTGAPAAVALAFVVYWGARVASDRQGLVALLSQ